jgi:hypothetical protein
MRILVTILAALIFAAPAFAAPAQATRCEEGSGGNIRGIGTSIANNYITTAGTPISGTAIPSRANRVFLNANKTGWWVCADITKCQFPRPTTTSTDQGGWLFMPAALDFQPGVQPYFVFDGEQNGTMVVQQFCLGDVR